VSLRVFASRKTSVLGWSYLPAANENENASGNSERCLLLDFISIDGTAEGTLISEPNA
jgi:hypothetical protein